MMIEELNILSFVMILLAVWRVTHLLQAEDGPFDLVFRLRKLAGESMIGKMMDCFYCLSVWVALVPAGWIGDGWMEKILLWLAASGGACLMERMSAKNEISD